MKSKDGILVKEDGKQAWLLLEPFPIQKEIKDRLKKLLRK